MTVPFQQIPSSLRTPLFYAEVSNSQANTNPQAHRALLIGQPTAAGSAVANLPTLVPGADGAALFGIGSQLDLMIRAYRANDPFGELWALPVPDAGGAAAAAGSFVVAGTASAAGTLYVYVGNVLIPVAVTSGMTAAAAATAIFNAINAVTALPVTSTNGVAGTAAIAAKNLGAVGNDLQLNLNLLGPAAGQTTPAGLVVTVNAMSGGSVNPTLTTALGNLADVSYDFIASAYSDATNLAAIGTFLSDATGRWSWQIQVYGHQFAGYRGTVSTAATYGQTFNDQHLSIMAAFGSASAMMEWAAAVCAATAVSVRADPAQPLQTISLKGLNPPSIANKFTLSQRETLLTDGVSTFTVDSAGNIAVSRLITTYQKNAFGAPDNSYLSVETLYTLMEVLRRLAGVITSKYARAKLAANGTRFAPGSNIVTPAIIAAALVAQYREMEYAGLVQGSGQFAANIIVQQNATNPNRVDVLYPAILIGQLNVLALLAQFRLAVNTPAATDPSAALP